MNKIIYIPDTVYLHINIKAKKKSIDEVLTHVYNSISPTHKEEGCLQYKVLRDGSSIIIIGKWKNKMYLDMHCLLQFHLELFEETLPPLCKKISIRSYKEIDPPITSLSLI